MTYRAITAVASGGAGDDALFTLATAVAGREGGVLRVVPAFPAAAAAYAAYGAALSSVPPELLERIRASEQQDQARIEAAASAAATAHGVRCIVEARELSPAEGVLHAAILSDLVCFSGVAARGALSGLFAEGLLHARTPMLVANGAASTATAAIAWDGSAQAGRAVRAALPFLRSARAVQVLSNTEDVSRTEAAPERLIAYLRLHGVEAAAQLEIGGDDVAMSLLQAAKGGGCDLLVAGAYGRPRLAELVLGGTTRALINAVNAPNLLLAH